MIIYIKIKMTKKTKNWCTNETEPLLIIAKNMVKAIQDAVQFCIERHI
jgi:hypothetical protein